MAGPVVFVSLIAASCGLFCWRNSPPRLSLLRMALSAKLPEIGRSHLTSSLKTAALIFTVLFLTAVSAQAQKPTTGYAPVNGLQMYYEIHGSGGGGEPLVLLHGSFMTISSNWSKWIGE